MIPTRIEVNNVLYTPVKAHFRAIGTIENTSESFVRGTGGGSCVVRAEKKHRFFLFSFPPLLLLIIMFPSIAMKLVELIFSPFVILFCIVMFIIIEICGRISIDENDRTYWRNNGVKIQ
jgi:hypothetical protein